MDSPRQVMTSFINLYVGMANLVAEGRAVDRVYLDVTKAIYAVSQKILRKAINI